LTFDVPLAAQGEERVHTQAAKKNEQVPHHCKRKGGKEDKDNDGKRQEGKAHRQNANIIA
jgi:hypothetical protein